jgi:hypothetical protein
MNCMGSLKNSFHGSGCNASWNMKQNKAFIFNIWRNSMWPQFVAMQTPNDFVPDAVKHVHCVWLQSSKCSLTVDFSHRRLCSPADKIQLFMIWTSWRSVHWATSSSPLIRKPNLQSMLNLTKKLGGTPSCWKLLLVLFYLHCLQSVGKKNNSNILK